MGEIVKYEAEGLSGIDVVLEEETVWLTQSQLVMLFASSKANISEHIKHIFQSEELEQNSVVRKFRTTAADGKTYNTNHYNLDVIIAVGYRVNTKRGTHFRQWATRVLREHLLRGYTIKQGVSMEQFQMLAGEIKEVLQRQEKMDSFVYEEFGRVYEIISEITEQKRLQETAPRKKIGFRFPHEENDNKK